MGEGQKSRYHSGRFLRPTNHDKEADNIFCKQLREVSKLLALLLVGNFNLPDCFEYNTPERKTSRSILESVQDKFLTQLVS